MCVSHSKGIIVVQSGGRTSGEIKATIGRNCGLWDRKLTGWERWH